MYKLEITDDMSDLEKFVRQEADNYVNSTIFLSSISDHHKNIDSVVEKGKEVTPYVVKLYKENGEYSNQNMYTHFFLIVMQRLYGNPFEGYVGMEFCVRYWLKRYEHDLLDDYDGNTDDEKERKFLLDLFDCKSIEELKAFFKPEAYVRPDTQDSEEDSGL
jgi:hypothetical protein